MTTGAGKPAVPGRRLPIWLKQTALRAAGAFKNAVFPLRCQICGIYFDPPPAEHRRPEVDEQPDGWSGRIDAADSIDPPGDIDAVLRARYEALLAPHVCSGCLGGFKPIRKPFCRMCGVVFKSRATTEHLCGDCINRPKNFHQARSAGFYAPGFMELLHQLKYRGRIQLAEPLGELLLTAFLMYWPKDDFDLVLPVPLHKQKLRQRGFNQALLLVDKWGRSTTRRSGPRVALPVDRTTLVRTKPTAPQTGLGRTARRQNIKQAFNVSRPGKINAKRILLVDDVYTTGATAGECARELIRAGAARVDVLTLARAI